MTTYRITYAASGTLAWEGQAKSVRGAIEAYTRTVGHASVAEAAKALSQTEDGFLDDLIVKAEGDEP